MNELGDIIYVVSYFEMQGNNYAGGIGKAEEVFYDELEAIEFALAHYNYGPSTLLVCEARTKLHIPGIMLRRAVLEADSAMGEGI